jgi:hypothetical protein
MGKVEDAGAGSDDGSVTGARFQPFTGPLDSNTMVAVLMRVRIPSCPPIEVVNSESEMSTDLNPLPANMRDVVERLYAVFGEYRAPTHLLDVCTGCCMDAALEKEMRSMPLRKITAKHFYEYNTSAKSTVQPVEEMKYLLPRMLELLACGAELHHSTELYLDRLGRCEAGAFAAHEYEAIAAFAVAYFAHCLSQDPWSAQRNDYPGEAFDVLLMWEIGGCNLQRLLDHWLNDASRSATLHYVQSLFFALGREHCNAFAKNRHGFHEVLNAWRSDVSNRRIFSQRIVELDWDVAEPRPICYYGGEYTQKDLAQTVFDLITE